MFWLSNKKIIFQYTLLSGGLGWPMICNCGITWSHSLVLYLVLWYPVCQSFHTFWHILKLGRIVCAQKIAFISLPINLNMCFVCSKGPSKCDGSFEHPQHMFWLSNKKNNFPVYTLIWRSGLAYRL